MCELPNPELLNGLHEGVYLVDRECRIHFWNQAAVTISGYCADEVLGKRCSDDILVHVDDRGVQKCGGGCPLRQTMSDGQSHEVEVYLLHKNGHRVSVSVRTTAIRDLEGNVIGGLEAFTSSDRQGRRLGELEAIAFTDPLTGVANRRCFENKLARTVEDAHTAESPLSLILVDVNDFKSVNDTFGHSAGDAALITVARTLRESVRRSDLVARWGGDEFAIILPGASPKIASAACDRIQALVRQARTRLESQDINITISIGFAALNPPDNAATLVDRADQQLFIDKRRKQLIPITTFPAQPSV